jgi:hypothetical protein
MTTAGATTVNLSVSLPLKQVQLSGIALLGPISLLSMLAAMGAFTIFDRIIAKLAVAWLVRCVAGLT